MSTEPVKRFPAVDIIRGFCILNVVVHHTNIRIPFVRSSIGSHLPDWLIRFLFWTGDYSVKVFFVISGFLITTSVLARWGSLGQVNVLSFYRRRFARIAPCLVAVVAILSVLQLLHTPGFTIAPGRPSLPRALLAVLGNHVNYLEASRGYLPGAWDVLWSLSVEEMFYLLYPLLSRFGGRVVLGISALALIICGPFARTIWAFNDIWADYSYFSGADAIAIGCIAALVLRYAPPPKTWAIPLRVAGALTGLLFFKKIGKAIGLLDAGLDVSVFACGVGMILSTLQSDTGVRWLRPVQWFGRNSYEIYLTHMFVVSTGTLLYQKLGSPVNYGPLWFAANLAITGVLGHLVSQKYSNPLNRRISS